MPRFAQISDIHYRPLSRHAEYREVFKAFAESCWEKGVEHIVVTGDIYHNKTTGISPEYIDELTWWIRTLTSVAPLHLVLGNHDLNLSNRVRQDAISPIVETLKNDSTLANPVYLYKHSGVYPVDKETNLCVFSVCDEEGFERVKPELGKVNIATYHGPVATAVTEVGWALESDVTIEKFRDFDVCMLGDIHKTQYLGYKDVKGVSTPWIGYPGSAVQQNYAEDVIHGYFLWDVNNDSHAVSFVPLPNPMPFVTVSWSNEIELVKVPQRARVRIKHTKPLSQSDTRRAIDFFKKEFSATEVIFNLVKSDEIKVVSEKAAKIRQNLHNVETLMDLLKRYDTTNSLDQNDWSEIKTIVSGYVSGLSSSEADVVRNVKWSIKDLKFDNIMGYGSDNNVRFEDLNGIVGVFGPNRVGKSSILAALTYCLFNSSDRGPLKNLQMVNVRKPHAYSRVVLSSNGTDYVVERQTVRQQNKKEEVGVTSVNLFKMEGGEAVDLNGEQRADTDKMIRSLIGNSDDFMMMSMSTQGDIDRFIREGSTHRKQVLARFLDLDFMDQLHDSAKSDTSTLKAEVKFLSSSSLGDTQKILESRDEVQSSLDKVSAKKVSQESELSLARKSLDRLEDNARLYKVGLEKREKLGRVIEALLTAAETRKERLDLIAGVEEQIVLLEEQLLSYDPEELTRVIDQVSKAKDLIRTKEREHDKLQSEVVRAKKSVSVLQEVPCGDSFPSCKFIRDAHLDKKQLEALQDNLIEAEKSLDEASKALGKLDENKAKSELKRHLETQVNLQKSKAILSEHRLKLADIDSKVSSLEAVRDSLAEQVDEYPKFPPAGYDEIEKKVDDLRSIVRTLDAQISSLTREVGVLNERAEKASESQEKLKSSLSRLKRHEFLSHAFSKKGIPASVLSEQLPLINQEISSILAGIVDFNIELECEAGSSSLEIYINYGDSRRAIELCSGMEKMIASLAIRVAMTNVSTVPKSDVMVIDEGFGALDESNVDAVKRMLLSIKRYFKSILIISHVPAIKDVADTILEVRRNEKDSRITH